MRQERIVVTVVVAADELVVICSFAQAQMTSGVGENVKAMWKIEENEEIFQ